MKSSSALKKSYGLILVIGLISSTASFAGRGGMGVGNYDHPADLNNRPDYNRVDTNNITPLIHPDEHAKQRLRTDVVTEKNVRDIMQSIAPLNSTEAGLYLVPKVIETE